VRLIFGGRRYRPIGTGTRTRTPAAVARETRRIEKESAGPLDRIRELSAAYPQPAKLEILCCESGLLRTNSQARKSRRWVEREGARHMMELAAVLAGAIKQPQGR